MSMVESGTPLRRPARAAAGWLQPRFTSRCTPAWPARGRGSTPMRWRWPGGSGSGRRSLRGWPFRSAAAPPAASPAASEAR